MDNRHSYNIIAQSNVMQELLAKVAKISRSNASVMIYGESGTGKELIAQSIHASSSRKAHAFVPIDCVALPENLMESEIFGHEKGAFTGAQVMRRGLFEYADDGTLFLDEICELPVNLQAKLLRALQEKEFRRIGGKRLIKVDLRIISATNKKPSEAVTNQLLREDLYYRLNVIALEIPPLRKRSDDIPLLANHYLNQFCKSNGIEKKCLESEAMAALRDYSWPGNVRELKNVIESLVSLVEENLIQLADLPEHITVSEKVIYKKTNGFSYLQAKNEFEKEYFTSLLIKYGENMTQAAQRAQVSRATLYRMINAYQLDKSVWKESLPFKNFGMNHSN